MPRRGWQGWVQRLLPWYDPEAERQRNEHSAKVYTRAITVRIEAERIREAYRKASERVRR